MIKFVLESYIFKRFLILSVFFIVLLVVAGKIFDLLWNSSTAIPIVTLDEVYAPPPQYDNFKSVKLKMISRDKIAIEGNRRFLVKGHTSGFDYFDTVSVEYPGQEFDRTNKIFFQFEETPHFDSIYLVIAKSDDPKVYYKQIFYSSVIVSTLNEFSDEPAEFRIDDSKLVSPEYLANNDTLINRVFNYFNSNIDNLGIAECGRNCQIFQRICNDFGVPCRMINLQGGDVDQTGYNDLIGYPLHVVCEIYSSKQQKWYVVDPSFGFRFRHKHSETFMNAIEVSNKHTFRREDEIVQDSILLTKRTLVGKDYFKYYENVIFSKPEWKNKYLRKLVSVFYGNFNYYLYLFSNNFPGVKNGFYYIGMKTFMYFFMLILYINAVLFLLLRRLFLVKKPKK